MNRKKQTQTELSYYGLYLLNHLRENRFPQASDADFIRERADHAAEVYEQARRDALFADAAQELAMSALLKGLRFSKYSILYDVVDSEFSLEVAVEDLETNTYAFIPCRKRKTCQRKYLRTTALSDCPLTEVTADYLLPLQLACCCPATISITSMYS